MTPVAYALALALTLGTPPAASPSHDPSAPPTTPDIRNIDAEAARLVGEGRYDEAIALIDDAQDGEPNPAFVFMKGVIEERRGRCDAAVEHYRLFLTLDVPESDAQEARAGLQRCHAQAPPPAAANPAAEEAPPQTTDPPAPTPRPEDLEADPRPAIDDEPPPRARPDAVGWTLLGVGSAGIVTGIGVLLGAQATARSTRGTRSLSMFEEDAGRAGRMQTAGFVVLGLSAALAIGGIVRLSLVARRPRSSP